MPSIRRPSSERCGGGVPDHAVMDDARAVEDRVLQVERRSPSAVRVSASRFVRFLA